MFTLPMLTYGLLSVPWCTKRKALQPGSVVYTLNPALRKQRQVVMYEFEVSLVYREFQDSQGILPISQSVLIVKFLLGAPVSRV